MDNVSVRPETLAGDPFAVDLAEAILEDEAELGRPHTPREREAFSAGFNERYEELHHAVPRCLLRLHDAANAGDLDGEGIQLWLEYEHECMRWGVDVEIDRADLERLVEASTVLLDRDEHRSLHESDFARWGRRGGLETVRRYGTEWMAALALVRWGRLDAEDLRHARVIGHGLPIKGDAGEGSAA